MFYCLKINKYTVVLFNSKYKVVYKYVVLFID